MTLDFERSLKIEIKAQQNDVGISRMLKLIIRFYLMALQKPNQLVFTKHYSEVILLSRSTNCCCPLRSDFIRATVHEVEQQCGNAMVLVFKSHFPTFEPGKSETLTQVIDGILLLCTAIIIKCPYEKIAS